MPKEHKRFYVLFPESSIARCLELGKENFRPRRRSLPTGSSFGLFDWFVRFVILSGSFRPSSCRVLALCQLAVSDQLAVLIIDHDADFVVVSAALGTDSVKVRLRSLGQLRRILRSFLRLRRQIKIACAERGIMFAKFVEDACREKLAKEGYR